MRFSGPLYGFFALGQLIPDSGSAQREPVEQLGYTVCGAGWLFASASLYVMRADPLPPRKNVFSRAADRLAELYDEYRKPALRPVGITE